MKKLVKVVTVRYVPVQFLSIVSFLAYCVQGEKSDNPPKSFGFKQAILYEDAIVSDSGDLM